MGLIFFCVLVVCGWILVEVLVKPPSVRVCTGLVVLAFSVILAWFGSSTLETFESTLETNNLVKNLTRGLVSVIESEPDSAVLRRRLVELNDAIVPSYEDHDSARRAVELFLKKYGIAYEAEIPISSGATIKSAELAPESTGQ